MSDWRAVCQVGDVEEGSPLSVEVGGNPVGIFCVDGAIFAIGDVCPHEYALLSTGYQEGDTVECPLHQAMFNIKTGENLTPPATCGVRVYHVKIEGGYVLVNCVSAIEGGRAGECIPHSDRGSQQADKQ